MADLDNQSKRMNGVSFRTGRRVLPIADGSMDQFDRQMLARAYLGILVGEIIFTQIQSVNQSMKQQAFREIAGTELSYNEDLMSACITYLGGGEGSVNELMTLWLEDKLSTTGSLNELMNAAAQDKGKSRWEDLDGDDIFELLS